jgi:hypothetical protein
MKLNEITLPLMLENVEKLIPYITADVKKYIDATQSDAEESPPEMEEQELEELVSYILDADPKYREGISKGKSPSRIKAPFARKIAEWWLDPVVGGGIKLPEDSDTIAEFLQKVNLAMQKGFNQDPRKFATFQDLQNAVEPFIDRGSDSYEDMGLDLVMSEGPYKIYEVGEWIDGEQSTKYTDQICHRAFQGTEWCVKYKNNFTNTYDPPYYMVTKNGKRLALIDFGSGQFKNIKNQRFVTDSSTDSVLEEAILIVKSLIKIAPNEAAALLYRDRRSAIQLIADNRKNDFGFLLDSEPDILSEIAARAIERMKAEVDELVQEQDFPALRARIKRSLKVNSRWLDRIGSYNDLMSYYIGRGRELAEDIVATIDPTELMAWAYFENKNDIGQPWPEMDSLILKNGNPILCAGWASSFKNDIWPEAEKTITTDPTAIELYNTIPNVKLREGIELTSSEIAKIGRKAKVNRDSEDIAYAEDKLNLGQFLTYLKTAGFSVGGKKMPDDLAMKGREKLAIAIKNGKVSAVHDWLEAESLLASIPWSDKAITVIDQFLLKNPDARIMALWAIERDLGRWEEAEPYISSNKTFYDWYMLNVSDFDLDL